MTAQPHISDADRRARLAVRHGLHPDVRLPGPLAVARAMTALHATDPSTVHLTIRSRTAASIADIDTALYGDRSLVKQLAMRRTLWALPRELLPAFAGRVERSPGKAYASVSSIMPTVLTLMGAEGRIVRGHNASHWRVARPQWTLTEAWLGSPATPLSPVEGYAVLLRSWLRTFGPGTEADIVWWFGATKAAMRAALADIGAVPVTLDSGGRGWVLPEDTTPTGDGPSPADIGPWAALLPTLDPSTVGWRGRDFHLPPQHVRHLFDSVGNGGTTVWLNGRIIGAWIQDDAGRVQPILLEKVSWAQQRLIDTEARALTDWLDGEIIANLYKSALMTGECLP